MKLIEQRMFIDFYIFTAIVTNVDYYKCSLCQSIFIDTVTAFDAMCIIFLECYSFIIYFQLFVVAMFYLV